MQRGITGHKESGAAHLSECTITLSRRHEAEEYHALGCARYAQGQMDDAAACCRVSLEIYPTAEAHTTLASVLAARGLWEEAIRECRKAIGLNPEMGNAYNDIGVYLERVGRTDEAVEWFERALNAPRYDCRHYPWYHLGRIAEQKGQMFAALHCYRESLLAEPDWEPARLGLMRVHGWLN